MENRIMMEINFKLNYPSPMVFLDHLNETYQLPKKQYFLCLYILELGLLDPKHSLITPSKLAMAAIYLSNK